MEVPGGLERVQCRRRGRGQRVAVAAVKLAVGVLARRSPGWWIDERVVVRRAMANERNTARAVPGGPAVNERDAV